MQTYRLDCKCLPKTYVSKVIVIFASYFRLTIPGFMVPIALFLA